jgi:hypothetical protein
VRKPRPSGLYATKPIPSSRQSGRSSAPTSRVHREFDDGRHVHDQAIAVNPPWVQIDKCNIRISMLWIVATGGWPRQIPRQTRLVFNSGKKCILSANLFTDDLIIRNACDVCLRPSRKGS